MVIWKVLWIVSYYGFKFIVYVKKEYVELLIKFEVDGFFVVVFMGEKYEEFRLVFF